MLEAPLTLSITKALRKEGAYVVKQHGGKYGTRGVPDLLVCYEGRFVGLEVKTPERLNAVTPEQKHHIGAILLADGNAKVVTSVKDALVFLDRIDERIDHGRHA